MAPHSIAPDSPPASAVDDRRLRQLLSAWFQTECQVASLPSLPSSASSASWQAIAEHARSVGPYLVDLCAARQLDVLHTDPEDGEPLVSSSSPAEVVRHELELVRRLGALAVDSGDTGLRRFCEGWLSARVPHVEAC